MNTDVAVRSEPQQRIGFRRVFRHPLFTMVWVGAFVSNIGNWMENSAQNWAVVSAVQNDLPRATFLSEILNFADFAPAFFLVLIAGVITDRVNLRRYLLWLQGLACLMGALLAVTAFLGWASPWVVIWFTFAEGIVWALNGPPWQTLVPHLVPREELAAAIAANSAQFNLARLVGPFLAGLVIVRFDVAGAFAVNAMTFAPVMFALWKLPPEADTRKRDAGPRGPLLKELGSGITFVRKHAGLRRLAIMLAAFTFLAAPVQGLLAVYVREIMHGDSRLYGVMLGAIGLGALAGALIIGKIPAYYPRHHLIPLAMSFGACFILGFTRPHSVPWVCFIMLVGTGFFDRMLSINSSNAAAQLLAGDENRGRIMSVILLCHSRFYAPRTPFFASALAHFMGLRLDHPLDGRRAAGDRARIPPPPRTRHRRHGTRGIGLRWWEAVWEALTAQSHRPVPAGVREELADEAPAVPETPRNG